MGLTSWTEVSKAVGYTSQDVAYPTEDQVREAGETKCAYKLLTWHRFLAPPENNEQRKVSELVNKLLEKVKKGMDD